MKATPTRLRADALALGVVGLAVLAVAWPALVGGELLYRGEIHEVLEPVHRLVAAERAAGRGFPLWNPYAFFGYPWLAAPQACGLYPPNALLPWLGPTDAALTRAIFAHLALAAAATYAFVRLGLRLGATGAALAAGIYALDGHMLGNVEQLHNHATLAWAPLVLLALSRALDPEAHGVAVRRWAALGALAFGLSALGGMTQQSLYLGLLFLAWWAAHARRAGSRRAFGVAAAIFGLGSLLFAVQLLPTLELVGRSARAASSGADALADPHGSLGLADLVGLVVPNLAPAWAERGWQAANALHVGLVPVALAAGLLSTRRAWRDGRARFFALLLLVASLFGLGLHGPVASLLYRLPGMTLFRDPARAASLIGLAVAVLAAFALDGAPSSPALRRRVAGAGVGLAALVGGALALGRAPQAPLPFEVAGGPGPGTALGLVGLAAAIAALLLRGTDPGRATATLAALGLAALVLGGRGLVATRPAAELRAEAARGFAPFAEVDPSARAVRLDRPGPLAPPFETEFRVRTTSGFSSLIPESVLRFTRAGADPEPLRLEAYRDFLRSDPHRAVAAARVVVHAGADGRPRLDRDPTAFPRAFVVSSAPVDLRRVPTLAPVAAAFLVDEPDRVVIELDAPAGPVAGWLVLADTDHPGWRARVDGARADIETAYGVFRAVQLAPGARRVEMVYRPRALAVGAGLSALGLTGVALLAFGRAAGRSSRGRRGGSDPGPRSRAAAPA